ncbi:restriction endonuclease [Saprospira sp. CCB-QB6]|uniref:5-methylcytosine restriction system specificity protein McrC n=1 Tax=Saprospira sp. CCB-QB6 TaxID=3023936 RepID=UPI0023492FDD|nr:restriction endonuclease [Saprospira sp. CCB-QB6]WCL81543.1 restriction endonuclease [Saprospira sp. CCB-QB6]
MQTKKQIQIFEQDRLYLGPDLDEAQLQSLLQLGSPYVFPIHQGLRWGNFVGLVETESLCVEILPKLEKAVPKNQQQHRQILHELLAYSQAENLAHWQNWARQDSEKGPWLSHYRQKFLAELQRFWQGPQEYKQLDQAGRNKSWQGQIDFSKLQPPVQLWPYLRRSVKQAPPFLFLLVWTLEEMWAQGLAPKEKQLIQSLLEQLPMAPTRPLQINWVAYAPRNPKGQLLFELARLFLAGLRPSTQKGKNWLWSFLLPMPQLFEQYLAVSLGAISPQSWTLSLQAQKPFWESRQLRADCCWEDAYGKRILIEVKWKLLEQNLPSEQDLRQIYTYQQEWSAEEGWLVYPAPLGRAKMKSAPFASGKGRARLLEVPLVQNGQLNKQLGQSLLLLALQNGLRL